MPGTRPSPASGSWSLPSDVGLVGQGPVPGSRSRAVSLLLWRNRAGCLPFGRSLPPGGDGNAGTGKPISLIKEACPCCFVVVDTLIRDSGEGFIALCWGRPPARPGNLVVTKVESRRRCILMKGGRERADEDKARGVNMNQISLVVVKLDIDDRSRAMSTAPHLASAVVSRTHRTTLTETQSGVSP